HPAVLYLDGARGPYLGKAAFDWDFDALYSAVKTLAPECVILVNSNDDDVAGDCDAFSYEGDNDRRPYWARWPGGLSGRNPKRLACETWRYPFGWAQWKGIREKPKDIADD